jgi:putative glutamine amidotransferase
MLNTQRFRRPRIGITSGLGGPHWRPDGSSWRPYAAAIEAAGGEAVHLDAATLGRERAVLEGLDGVVFSGGKDIHLSLYPNPPDLEGEDPERFMARYRMNLEPDRDAYELPLLTEALHRDLPVLGICRGCQVLNVGVGGRLILDIPTEIESPLRHAFCPQEKTAGRHTLRIQEDSLLANILHPGQFQECNSRHHQAVRPGETGQARVVALSPEDGIVEAIEVPARRWVVGVQWHPEHQTDPGIRQMYTPLFRAFIDAASS